MPTFDLKAIPLFAGIPDEHLTRLLSRFRRDRLSPTMRVARRVSRAKGYRCPLTALANTWLSSARPVARWSSSSGAPSANVARPCPGHALGDGAGDPGAFAGVRAVPDPVKPGGRLLVLEFSKVWEPLSPFYDLYSFKVLPWLGSKIVGDADSYRYLAESIRMHPDQEALKSMMEQAGFDAVEYHNLTAGVVALHVGRVW